MKKILGLLLACWSAVVIAGGGIGGGYALIGQSSATLPATCTVGTIWFDNNATAGQNVYGCTATNVWTLQGDGTGAGGVTSISAGSGIALTPNPIVSTGSVALNVSGYVAPANISVAGFDGATAAGGNVTLRGGDNSDPLLSAGTLTLRGGNNSNTGGSGSVIISGGTGAAVGATSGDVNIFGGDGDSTSGVGQVLIQAGSDTSVIGGGFHGTVVIKGGGNTVNNSGGGLVEITGGVTTLGTGGGVIVGAGGGVTGGSMSIQGGSSSSGSGTHNAGDTQVVGGPCVSGNCNSGNVSISTSAPTGTGSRGTVQINNLAGGSTNHAVCWKANGVLGYCSVVVDASGVCGTCN